MVVVGGGRVGWVVGCVGWWGWVQMLTSVYDNANSDDNDDINIVIGIAQLSLSAVLKSPSSSR